MMTLETPAGRILPVKLPEKILVGDKIVCYTLAAFIDPLTRQNRGGSTRTKTDHATFPLTPWPIPC
jgi:hypothetical protein